MLTSSLIVLYVSLIGQGAVASKAHDSGDRHERSSPDKGMATCAVDYTATSVCVACADLPTGMGVPLEACCDSEYIQTVCATCLMDLDSCARDIINVKLDELESVKSELDEEEPLNDDGLSKRFGRLFMGSGRYGYGYSNRDDKRYGRLFMSPNPSYYRVPHSYQEKRFGTLFMGNRGMGSDQQPNKRYGTLFMRKRFGRLFLGSGYSRWRDDKRSRDTDLPIDLNGEDRRKRYGRLFLSTPRRTGSADKKSA